MRLIPPDGKRAIDGLGKAAGYEQEELVDGLPIPKTHHIEEDGTDIVLPQKISASSTMGVIPLVRTGMHEVDPREDAQDAASRRAEKRRAMRGEPKRVPRHFAEYGDFPTKEPASQSAIEQDGSRYAVSGDAIIERRVPVASNAGATGTSSIVPVPVDSAEMAARSTSVRYKKRSGASRWVGLLLIVAGIALIAFAGAFFLTGLEPPDDVVRMEKTGQYEVPDGMLQEGAADMATDIVYIYDLESDEEPYAVESHAVKDGMFGQTEDLYEKWDGTSTFKEAMKEEKVTGDVVNFRQIVVHLPMEARGLVAGDAGN